MPIPRFLRLIHYTLACCLLTNAVVAQTPAKKRKRPHHTEENPDATPAPSPDEQQASPTPDQDARKSAAAPDATISTGQITEFSGELPRVQKLLESALALTTQNLTYTYDSDDPANGGMDCSGFTAYVLRKNGFPDVPRDASGQYVWLRKAGTFRAVLSQSPDTFELNELRPGDVLFWIGTYATDHDPPVTHTMIYLGTEKGTGHRIMAGSSDGRAYQGKTRWGVSVFDFNITAPPPKADGKPNRSMFVGYASPPGLRD